MKPLFIFVIGLLATTLLFQAQASLVTQSGGRLYLSGVGGDSLLSWDASSHSTGYHIYWNATDVAGPPYANNEDVGAVTSASPTGFDSGEVAVIKAYDESGLEGPPSAEINAPSCDQTISVGANIATTLSGAANNSVVCFNNGDYGSVNLWDMIRTGYVTARAVNPGMATFSPQPGNSRFMRFIGFTMEGSGVDSCSQNIVYQGNTFTAQMVYRADGCSSHAANIYIDGNSFCNINTGGGIEGRLEILNTENASGIYITNNTFCNTIQGEGESDGIQVAGADGVQIGPGNKFIGLRQDAFGTHVDAIQLLGHDHVTIEGNYFSDNSIMVGSYDGGSNTIIRNNIFDSPNIDETPFPTSWQHFQLCVATMTIEHNTFLQSDPSQPQRIVAGCKSANDPNTGWTFRNNVMSNSAFFGSGDQPGCGTGCVVANNLLSGGSSTSPTGTGNVTNTAVFNGSGSSTNWHGFRLASGPGKNAGTDGKDMGTLFVRPAAPGSFEE